MSQDIWEKIKLGSKGREPTFDDCKSGIKGLFSPFVTLYDKGVEAEKELTKCKKR